MLLAMSLIRPATVFLRELFFLPPELPDDFFALFFFAICFTPVKARTVECPDIVDFECGVESRTKQDLCRVESGI